MNVPEELYLTRKYLAERAEYRITQSIKKNVNKYEIAVDTLQETPSILLDTKKIFPFNFFPVGSSWSSVLGWRSFFGIPFQVQEQYFLFLGVHIVVKNPFGGAFPYTEGYVYQFNNSLPLAGLSRLSAALHKTSSEIYGTGIIKSTASSVKEHKLVEAKIIQSALSSYSIALEQENNSRNPLYFQTFILSEDQFYKPDYPNPTWWGNRSNYLLAVSTFLSKSFSWKTKLSLFMCKAPKLQ
jgi:hypothetical protein